jgi:hypothetical protein
MKIKSYLVNIKEISNFPSLIKEIIYLLEKLLKTDPEEVGLILIEDSKENRSIEYMLDNYEQCPYPIINILCIVTCLREDHSKFLSKHY